MLFLLNMSLDGRSKEFIKGVTWLRKAILLDENELQKKIDDINNNITNSTKEDKTKLMKTLKDLNTKKELKIDNIRSIEAYYILYKNGDNVIKLLNKATENKEYWDEIEHFTYEDTERLWYIKAMGYQDNEYFKKWIPQILREQTIEGLLHPNNDEHGGIMRFLNQIMPDSKQLTSAIKWWESNWNDYSDSKYLLTSFPYSILALIEIDSKKYHHEIESQINALKKFQNEDGSWEYIDSLSWKIITTRDAIWVISKFYGNSDVSALKGLNWILSKQRENGSWEDDIDSTGVALMALLQMGHGLKMPVIHHERELEKMKQKIKSTKPVFLHTSPLYKNGLHVNELHKTIESMLMNAKKEIRISSLYFDMFYEYIINMKNENPDLVLRIITRPKKDIKGKRERIAKNVIDLLEIASRGSLIQSELIHARLVIIDDTELLVSSADFTRDQLYDEYNAGIWTSDREAILNAIDFFDNIFSLETKD